MAEFDVEPELASLEVLTRAFLALLFYKMKRENLLLLSGENQKHDDPYRWAYLLSDGKVHMHPMVRLLLTSSGVNLHLTSSEVLMRFFLLACLHEINVDDCFSIHVVGEGPGQWQTWVYTIHEGKINLKEVEATIIKSGVDSCLISPEVLTKVLAGVTLDTVRKFVLAVETWHFEPVQQRPDPGFHQLGQVLAGSPCHRQQGHKKAAGEQIDLRWSVATCGYPDRTRPGVCPSPGCTERKLLRLPLSGVESAGSSAICQRIYMAV
ncbi:hypothetical protein CRENBAI_012209 [Crenichthys baileyi]|uniref:Uncharacterized protein n=1 Tax=Crenichthys baileyi TaxID=28760 RepID=A0AAV9S4V3_9TELE